LQTARLPRTGYDRKTKYLEGLEIPLPPLEEQRRIAAILDKAAETQNHVKRQLSTAKSLLASLFVETVGDPLKNPHGWNAMPLAEAVQAGTDVTSPLKICLIERKHPERYTTSLSISKVQKRSFSRICPSIDIGFILSPSSIITASEGRK
jgi:restriction endonuclease S subunit